MTPPSLALRRVRVRDLLWLTGAGLRREFAGVQYSRWERPFQYVVAPLRALLGPYVAACVVLVDGERAGYVGRSPLSRTYEYFLLPWARGDGRGRGAIAEFLAHHRAGDRARRFVVSKKNERSWRALRGALDDLGWTEGVDYRVRSGPWHRSLRVKPG